MIGQCGSGLSQQLVTDTDCVHRKEIIHYIELKRSVRWQPYFICHEWL